MLVEIFLMKFEFFKVMKIDFLKSESEININKALNRRNLKGFGCFSRKNISESIF